MLLLNKFVLGSKNESVVNEIHYIFFCTGQNVYPITRVYTRRKERWIFLIHFLICFLKRGLLPLEKYASLADALQEVSLLQRGLKFGLVR